MKEKTKTRWKDNQKGYKAEYARLWRKQNPDKARALDKIKRLKYKRQRSDYHKEYNKIYKKDGLKYRARVELNNAIKLGKLIRSTKCEGCKQEGLIEAHHSNYKKALEVNWLCIDCHSKVHHPIPIEDIIKAIKDN